MNELITNTVVSLENGTNNLNQELKKENYLRMRRNRTNY